MSYSKSEQGLSAKKQMLEMGVTMAIWTGVTDPHRSFWAGGSYNTPHVLALPREVVPSPSLEVFKTQLDQALSNLVWLQTWPALSRRLDMDLLRLPPVWVILWPCVIEMILSAYWVCKHSMSPIFDTILRLPALMQSYFARGDMIHEIYYVHQVGHMNSFLTLTQPVS